MKHQPYWEKKAYQRQKQYKSEPPFVRHPLDPFLEQFARLQTRAYRPNSHRRPIQAGY
jgi:hypothetical protein